MFSWSQHTLFSKRFLVQLTTCVSCVQCVSLFNIHTSEITYSKAVLIRQLNQCHAYQEHRFPGKPGLCVHI